MALIKKEKSLSASTEKATDNSLNNSPAKKSISQKKKKRNWAFVCYPESLPKDWENILRQTGLQVAISPLHDKDVEADEVTPKKPHYHIILVYNGPTSFSCVKELTDKLKAPIPIALEGVRGYYRYFSHLDNPEKYQYNDKEIKCLNGFSILDFCELTRNEVNQIKKKLIAVIINQKINEYSDFLDFVIANLSENEFDVASSHTYFFDRYLTSYRNKLSSKSTTVDILNLVNQAIAIVEEKK